jgi:ATP-dependent Zn protease
MRLLLFVLSLAIATDAAASCDQDLQDPNSAVQVVDASVTTTTSDGALFVTVIGELKNTTNQKIDDLVIEAKLTNSSGKVIDVISEPVYGLVVPAGQQVAFRLQTTAAADQASYSGVIARVVSGESHVPSTTRTRSQKSSRYVEILISWSPMIFLILVWVLLARRYSGKGSNQEKMLKAIGEQNALLTKQIAALETIASVVSAQKKDGDV